MSVKNPKAIYWALSSYLTDESSTWGTGNLLEGSDIRDGFCIARRYGKDTLLVDVRCKDVVNVHSLLGTGHRSILELQSGGTCKDSAVSAFADIRDDVEERLSPRVKRETSGAVWLY